MRHKVCVIELEPKLTSISQLMFFEGERNSVLVGVCGSSVPLVAEVVVVVEPTLEADVVVETGAEELVELAVDDDVVVSDGEPLEHDANSAAPAASTRTGTTRRVLRDLDIF